MHIVFVEYKVFPEKRGAYLKWIAELARAHPLMEHYEGSEQPNLFVELWPGIDEETYGAFKRQRLESADRPWPELAEYVPGGLDKVHIWHFRRSTF